MNEVYEWIQASIVNVINYVSGEYWGRSLIIFILFISCITLLFLNKDRLKRGYAILAVYSALLIVSMLLNPLTLKFYNDTRDAFALLPMCVIIACVIAIKSKNIVGKIKQNTVIIGLAILIVFAGLAIREENMVDSVNVHKVDDQGVITAQCILEESHYKPVTVCYILRDGDNNGTDKSAYEAALQYSGIINAAYAGPGDSQAWAESDYLVINNELIEADSVDIFGFDVVKDAGSYTVLSRA